MPIYEYECQGCQKLFEYMQSMKEDAKTECEECGGQLTKMISASGFILKGGGWYKDLYASAKPGASGAAGEGGQESKTAESKTAESKTTEGKTSEGKTSEGKTSEGKPTEGKPTASNADKSKESGATGKSSASGKSSSASSTSSSSSSGSKKVRK